MSVQAPERPALRPGEFEITTRVHDRARPRPHDAFGIDQEWPKDLFVIEHGPTGKYGCYHWNGYHGLAVFGSADAALRFADHSDMPPGMTALEVDWDRAVAIALERPAPVNSMMLCDDPSRPLVFFVK